MKSLVRYGNKAKEFRLINTEEPSPGDGEVKIKVEYAGICGTDLHMYEGHLDLSVPIIVGHEFSGTVVEVGKGVVGIKPGDRVTAEHTFDVCGCCSHCREGKYNLCTNRISLGFEKPGCFAEYVIAGSKYIHKLPDNVAFEEGALTEPIACSLHAVEKVLPTPGERALIIGPGPVGLLTGLCLKAHNCQVDIIGTESDVLRLEKAKQLDMNVVDQGACLGGNYDIIAECSGSQAARQELNWRCSPSKRTAVMCRLEYLLNQLLSI
ncbi:MAG: alcohol dehydrogenase catalytic domain-containing protein [Bacillota bacterium]